MPLYEYECEACGVRFERVQHFSDPPLSVCPDCGGKVHRVIHPVGIIFKGSGFYVTDNRSKSPTLSSNGGGKEEKKSEGSKESSSTDKQSD
ncbi:MAG: zinc ribbon domain-containing protein [Chloroflexi bacterium]|nr:zinc ribbon domain-containing protein [Chloroflexota bacterium]